MTKSHVSLEQSVCVVCANVFDTGALLLDQRLQQRFEMKTVTGWGWCPEHAAKKADGYIALVEIDEAKSKATHKAELKADEVYRTGPIVHVRSEAWAKLFNVPVPPRGIAYVSHEVIEFLKQISQRASERPADGS